MGSFVFKWPHDGSEVYLAGTFDGWSKSQKLEKTGDVFEKDVTLSNIGENIYYKFVVDNNWVVDLAQPHEHDYSGNLNNVLYPDRITKHESKPEKGSEAVAEPEKVSAPEAAPEVVSGPVTIMSGVGPAATTAELAKEVPLEKSVEKADKADLPGTFPETPAAETELSVNPLPATEGAGNPIKLAPGEKVPHPSEITTNTVTSGVHDDPELVALDKEKNGTSEPTFSVTPLPAFEGAINPVKVAPGEPLPDVSALTSDTVHSHVHTDKESYEKGAATSTFLPSIIPATTALIPESSLPMGNVDSGLNDVGPTIQSVGPESTTAKLAAQVPLESSKVPEVVKESQAEAGVSPEASAVPEEVKEKSAMEKELLAEVPTAPTTSEGTAGQGTDKSENSVTGSEAAAAIGSAAVAIAGAAAAYISGAAASLPESVTNKLPESMQEAIKPVEAPVVVEEAAKNTPEIVKESIAESGQAPEAAANEEAVLEKKAVEKELLSEIKAEPATEVAKTEVTKTEATEAVGVKAVSAEPEVTKPDVEKLVAEKPAATTEAAGTETKGTEDQLKTPEPKPRKSSESRDISPGTVPGSHSATTVPASATTETTAVPGSSVAASTSGKAVDSATDKKKKRTSIFGRIKAKFSDKEKK